MANTTLDGVTLPEKFRGRRRELRQLNNRLIGGELQQLLITGPGGQGKTALAGKLALTMQQAGWQVLAWSANEGKRWDGFLRALQLTLNDENGKQYDRVQATVEDITERAGYLLELLLAQAKGRLLLLLDNLESLQNEQSRALTDDAVQAFITAAQTLGNKGLVLLLTSRWLLPQWPDDQSDIRHQPLQHLNYGDFLQLCLLKSQQLAPLAEREQRLRQVYDVLNGNGRGLNFFAAAVQGMALKEEEQFLEKLSQAEVEVQTDMALTQVLAQRSDAQLDLLQRMQCYENPVPVEGIIKLAADLPGPKALLAELVAVSLVEKSYHPYWLADEYHCSALVAQAVNHTLQRVPATIYARMAVDYQVYLFRNERVTLGQAQVVHRAYMNAEQIEQAHRFALDTIVGPFNMAGLYQTLLDEWLPPICEAEDRQIRAGALGQTGKQYHHIGQYKTALRYLKQSLVIQQEIGHRSGEGTTLNNISQIYDARGDYEKALSCLKQSLTICQEIGDRFGEGTTLNNISLIFKVRGDYEKALSYLKQSLAIRQEIGDRFGEGTTLNNISQIFSARGDYEKALNYLKQSLVIQQETRDRFGEGATLNNISLILSARGDYETALSYLKQSLVIQQEIAHRSGEGTTLNNISQIYDARSDYEKALSYLKQSLAISQEIGDRSGEGTALNNMATTAHARGDCEKALSYLKQSLVISQEIGDRSGEGTMLNNISQIYDARGDDKKALIYLKQSLVIRQEIGDTPGLCSTLFNIGHIHRQNNEQSEALSVWVTVYGLAKSMGLAQALTALEELAGQLGMEGGLAAWEELAQQAEKTG